MVAKLNFSLNTMFRNFYDDDLLVGKLSPKNIKLISELQEIMQRDEFE